MAKLTNQEYVKHNGIECPQCGETDIRYNGIANDGFHEAWQNCTCNMCHSTWVEIYALKGYEDLETGKVT